jgi:hypothetical protein
MLGSGGEYSSGTE